MKQLHDSFNKKWKEQIINPLLLIATYILDFLCIHPFLDGNGRLSRLISLVLLYHIGHDVGRYISIEKIIEDTKTQQETGESEDERWKRIREEETAQDKEAVDYYNEEIQKSKLK